MILLGSFSGTVANPTVATDPGRFSKLFCVTASIGDVTGEVMVSRLTSGPENIRWNQLESLGLV